MPINVNGFVVPDDEVRQEALRLANQYPWKAAPASRHKSLELFNTAERNIVNRLLLAQYANTYPPYVDPEVLLLNELLDRLAKFDARAAQVTEMRIFLGLSEDEIASALGISSRTVRRDWLAAVAWIKAETAERGTLGQKGPVAARAAN